MKERITLYCLLSLPTILWIFLILLKLDDVSTLLHIGMFIIAIASCLIIFYTIYRCPSESDKIAELEKKIEDLKKYKEGFDTAAAKHEKEMVQLRSNCEIAKIEAEAKCKIGNSKKQSK